MELTQTVNDPASEFTSIYNLYHKLVRSVVYRLCINKDELDDLVQDVFIKIWKGLPGFKHESEYKTWVYKIAINTAKDNFKMRLKNIFISSENAHASRAVDSSKEEDFATRDVVNRGLNSLNYKTRSVMVLIFMEGEKIEDVAEILDIPPGTVKSRLHYGKKKLHEFFIKNGVME